jgi:hypothetical protein
MVMMAGGRSTRQPHPRAEFGALHRQGGRGGGAVLRVTDCV